MYLYKVKMKMDRTENIIVTIPGSRNFFIMTIIYVKVEYIIMIFKFFIFEILNVYWKNV